MSAAVDEELAMKRAQLAECERKKRTRRNTRVVYVHAGIDLTRRVDACQQVNALLGLALFVREGSLCMQDTISWYICCMGPRTRGIY